MINVKDQVYDAIKGITENVSGQMANLSSSPFLKGIFFKKLAFRVFGKRKQLFLGSVKR